MSKMNVYDPKEWEEIGIPNTMIWEWFISNGGAFADFGGYFLELFNDIFDKKEFLDCDEEIDPDSKKEEFVCELNEVEKTYLTIINNYTRNQEQAQNLYGEREIMCKCAKHFLWRSLMLRLYDIVKSLENNERFNNLAIRNDFKVVKHFDLAADFRALFARRY